MALFGAQPEASTPRPDPPGPQENPVQVASPLTSGPLASEAHITPDLATYIQEAIRKGIRQELLQRTSSWASDQSYSQVDVEGSIISIDRVIAQDTVVQGSGQAAATSSDSSDQESLVGADLRDQDISDDEDLAPD